MPKRKAQRKSGTLPGEARRKSLVTVDVVTRGRPDAFRNEDLTTQEHYIVESIWLDGEMRTIVSYKGETWRLPVKVVATIMRHHDSIVKERRSLNARERAMKAQAQADQAEAERVADLGGL